MVFKIISLDIYVKRIVNKILWKEFKIRLDEVKIAYNDYKYL